MSCAGLSPSFRRWTYAQGRIPGRICLPAYMALQLCRGGAACKVTDMHKRIEHLGRGKIEKKFHLISAFVRGLGARTPLLGSALVARCEQRPGRGVRSIVPVGETHQRRAQWGSRGAGYTRLVTVISH